MERGGAFRRALEIGKGGRRRDALDWAAIIADEKTKLKGEMKTPGYGTATGGKTLVAMGIDF